MEPELNRGGWKQGIGACHHAGKSGVRRCEGITGSQDRDIRAARAYMVSPEQLRICPSVCC